jgi:putative oxidoreductase
MNREILFLEGLHRHSDIGLVVLRLLAGGFLVYGVIDNVVDPVRMDEFSTFLSENDFPAPHVLAPLSVYLQLLCGIALTLGLLTRWVGIIIALHFVIALVMVHWAQDFRGWWPAIVLVGIGLQYALTGAGGLSVDSLIASREEK